MPTPANPDSNNFRCNSCGRFFNTRVELDAHETECRLAKVASQTGKNELEAEDSQGHAKNDADVREFQHGTRPS
jgi:hypothetical protein